MTVSENVLVDMYKIRGVPTPDNFVDNVKKTLSHRPLKCLGVRLLMNINDDSNYILVSYWPDEESMLSSAPSLHRQIMRAAEDAELHSNIENYEIKHEI